MSKSNGKVSVKEELCVIERSRIRVYTKQPRTHFNQESIKNLARSIARAGQKVPIIVRPVSDDHKYDYELIDGERRYRACAIAEIEEMKAIVRHMTDEDEQFEDSVLANFQNEEHTPLEKAAALKRLRSRYSVEEVADMCGYSVSWVTQHLSLLKLAPEVKKLIDPSLPKDMQLPYSLALRLSGLEQDAQRQVAAEITSGRKMTFTRKRYLLEARIQSQPGNQKDKNKVSRRPDKDFRSLQGFLCRTEDEATAIMLMPGTTFDRMFAERSASDIQSMRTQLAKTISELQMLDEILGDALSEKQGLKIAV